MTLYRLSFGSLGCRCYCVVSASCPEEARQVAAKETGHQQYIGRATCEAVPVEGPTLIAEYSEEW